MDHVIITFILLALAAKAKAQAKDNLINCEQEEKSYGKRGGHQLKGGSWKKSQRYKIVG